ncbi:hypothetical protein A2609_03475 [Candidatus Kaiserbacteria bacterium RIFOXYD1_FULL_47_14]|uniref:Metallo-beta-lactamase domain-containing protein n=1 Tax=Candidatus Kaiserbacteria bacterium RIFOXYD1_FULL_47_14 TaxID=1798533 RepID=A0A1F6G441_9BACT|nr:MAG: hypothetical protein A2609_03475 [Candidatus Kaiserbacteria bacterium RIFOXYD1_FULL_47_14]
MKNFYLILFFILIAGNIFIYQTIFAPRILEISLLEVGKGCATLVRTPNGKTLLIDTGPDASILRALGAALPFWQRRIDAVALTNNKSASVVGLQDVKNRYDVPTILHFGTVTTPYGARLALDSVQISILYASTLTIYYGSASISISSSTPKGVYISNGKTVTKPK